MTSRCAAQVVVFTCLATVPTRLIAADTPTFDYAGSYVLISGIGYGNSYPSGWMGAATWYPNQRLGIVAEVGGSYKTDRSPGDAPLNARIYDFMGGPKTVRRGSAASPFAQALFGATRVGNNYGGYQLDFAAQFGGGIDLTIGHGFGFRAQADYRGIMADWQCCVSEVRLAAGILFGR
jgi:hypothetical protein